MAIEDMWNSTLVYFGVREEEWEDEYDEDGIRRPRGSASAATASGRTCAGFRRDAGRARSSTRSSQEEPPGARPDPRRPGGAAPAPQQNGHREAPQVSLVVPKTFNDAQKVADKLKADVPVIINFQSADAELPSAG